MTFGESGSPANNGDANHEAAAEDANWRDKKIVGISHSLDIKSKSWEVENLDLTTFVALQMTHQERGSKGGAAYVPARLNGVERRKAAVERISLATLDSDYGNDLARVVGRMKELGWEGTVASSQSHLTTQTKITFDDYTKRFGEINVEGVTRYLIEVKGYLPEALGEVTIVHACKQSAQGIFVVVKHAPIQKGRITVVLKNDFVIVDQMLKHTLTVAEVQAKWAAILETLASLLGVKLDPACKDVSRAYFWPTHAPGAEYYNAHVEGEPVDFDAFDLSVPEASKRESVRKSTARKNVVDPALEKFAARHGKQLQLADFLEAQVPDKVRGRTSSVVGVVIECPFDAHHSNPGDTTDKGCFVINACDSSSGNFIWKCQHAGCQDRHRLDFIQEAINQGWFSLADLGKAVGSTEAGNPCEAAQEIVASLDRMSDMLEQRKLFGELVCCDDQLVRAQVLKTLKDKCGMNLGDTRAYLNDLLRKEKMSKAKRDDRPHFVYHDDDYGEIVNGVAAALEQANATQPRLYRMANNIVRLSVDPATGATVVETLTKAMLRQEINQLATFSKMQADTMLSISCPGDVADDLLNDPSLALPSLVAIVDAPYFDANGSIVASPGYNPDSYVWYQPRPDFAVPEVSIAPTTEELARAVWLIEDVLGEFPYSDMTTNNRSSKAHAICFLIEGFARLLIGGPTPIYLIQKPTPGTGASLFVNAVSHVNSGSAGIPQVELSSADEFRKNVTATLMNGAALYWIDNVHNKVDNASLALATTTEVWRDRVLQSSKTVVLPVNCTWCVSGNNVELSEELSRRCAMIRFDANVERPTERMDFRHADLIGYIRDNRPDLVWAALTLIQAWISAGKPNGTAKPLASFERWSQVMGGILSVAGIEGFLENRHEVREVACDDLGPVKSFISAWWEKFGTDHVPVTSTGVRDSCNSLLDLYFIHSNELDLGFNTQRKEAWPSALGKAINKVRNRVFEICGDGAKVRLKVRSERTSGGAVKWLEQV